MRQFVNFSVALGAIAVLAGCTPMTPPTTTAPPLGDSGYLLQQTSMVRAGLLLNTPEARAFMTVFREVNAFRVANGVPALRSETTLIRAAARHSQDMGTRNYLAHTSLDGTTAAARMRAAGATFNSWGENIGYQAPPDTTAAARMVEAWKNSPGHRANMLNPTFKRTGIYGYRRASDGYMYFTQVFAD
jgi:uncharacterized protein YkwD